MRRFLCCGVALVAVVRTALAAQEIPATAPRSEPSVEELEKKVVGYRAAIETGKVVLTTYKTHYVIDPTYVNFRRQYTIFFKPGKVRVDTKRFHPDRELYHTVLTENEVIFTPSAQWPVQVQARRGRTPGDLRILDPRLLGVYPTAVSGLSGKNLDEFMLRPDRKDLRMEKDAINGESVWKVTYKLVAAYEQEVRFWISPRQGYGMLRFETDRDFGSYRRTFKLLVDLSQYEQGGVWYPKKVVYQETKDGKLEEEEIASVEEAVFSREIPDETYSIAALNLSSDREFTVDGRSMVWNGAKLVPSAPDWNITGPPTVQWRTWVPFVCGAAVLAAISVGFFLNWRRKQRSRTACP